MPAVIRPTLVILLALSASSALAAVPDVRVVIDVSGSMKRTDPDGLRIGAVKILAGMLGDGNYAGIWTFGQQPNMIVKHGEVDRLWKQLALIQADAISSNAMHTDIESAIDAASWDRNDPPAGRDRHILLLTDGKIDISDEERANAASRARVTRELLAELKRAGIRLHTIALSAEADAAFLRQVAIATGGSHGAASEAGDLSRFFLTFLDHATAPLEISIAENGFEVDPSIEELTVLRFRTDGSETVLLSPTRQRIDPATPSREVSWFTDPGYDMITVRDPVPGKWWFESPMGAGDRVTVVSDLKLQVEAPPATIFPGYSGLLEVTLTDGEQIITDKDFLSLVNFEADIDTPRGNEVLLVEPSLGTPADGRFRVRLRRFEAAGEYTLNVRARGGTFERSVRRPTVLRDPVEVQVRPTESGGGVVWVSLSASEIDFDTLRMTGKVSVDGGPTLLQPAVRMPSGAWKILVEARTGAAEVTVDIKGRHLSGDAFSIRPDPIEIELPVAETSSTGISLTGEVVRQPLVDRPEPVVSPPVSDPVVIAEPPVVVPQAAVEPAPPEAPLISWPTVAAIIAGLNLIGGIVWWLLNRRSVRKDADGDGEPMQHELEAALAAVEALLDDTSQPEPSGIGGAAEVAGAVDVADDTEHEADAASDTAGPAVDGPDADAVEPRATESEPA